jgi:predicted flavoprotein YhiN
MLSIINVDMANKYSLAGGSICNFTCSDFQQYKNYMHRKHECNHAPKRTVLYRQLCNFSDYGLGNHF